MGRALTAVTLAIMLVATSAVADQVVDVVVLPLENLSEAEGVSADVTRLIQGAFIRKGWSVADSEPVDEILRSERVRYLDSLDGGPRSRVLRGTNSRGLVTGTIYEYTDGRDPTVALSVRLVTATGSLVWSNLAVVSASQTEGLFGFGRKSTLREVALAAVEKLVAPLPSPGEEIQPVSGPKGRRFGSSPTFYVTPETSESAPVVICVLPFVNESSSPNAARVVTDVLSLRLAAPGGLSTVDSASLRAALLQTGIGSIRRARPEELEALAAIVGTPFFLQGTVYEYGVDRGSRRSPRISVEFTLRDERTGRIIWVAQHERSGSDYEGLFLLGAEVSAFGLADRVVSELIQAAESAFAKRERAQSAGLNSRSRADLRQVVSAQDRSQPGGST